MTERRPQYHSVRLWWRCAHCAYRFDTFSVRGYELDIERVVISHDDRVHRHLNGTHAIFPDTYDEAASHFNFDRATSRVVKRGVLVPDEEARDA